MNSNEAMLILIGAFTLDGVMNDVDGNLIHLFAGDFDFSAAELDDATLRLSAQLGGLDTNDPEVARRLLEANLSGAETGPGAMARDPQGSGGYALIDTVDVSVLDAGAFKLRVVDFMLFVEYWRSEGVADIRRALHDAAEARGISRGVGMMRA